MHDPSRSARHTGHERALDPGLSKLCTNQRSLLVMFVDEFAKVVPASHTRAYGEGRVNRRRAGLSRPSGEAIATVSLPANAGLLRCGTAASVGFLAEHRRQDAGKDTAAVLLDDDCLSWACAGRGKVLFDRRDIFIFDHRHACLFVEDKDPWRRRCAFRVRNAAIGVDVHVKWEL
jgi:hypothetical protein